MPHRSRTGPWLLLAVLVVACADAPPVPDDRPSSPPPPAVAVPEPAPCGVIQAATCDGGPRCREVEVFGQVCHRTVRADESLIEMARDHDLGFNEIEAANPGLDAYVPTVGATVVIPTRWIVPRAARAGRVVVNLSEMRLYQFPAKAGPVTTFPVGIGTEGWGTPLGTFTVIQKQKNPSWYPPASIRREDPELPAVVPPGPDNPLGTHALRLSASSILIHGTDRPFGVGRKASHGCLRLYPEDIPILFGQVGIGAEVRVVREPVKVGVLSGRVLVEVHEDDDAGVDPQVEARRLLAKRNLLPRVDPAKLKAAVREARGYPVDVTDDRT